MKKIITSDVDLEDISNFIIEIYIVKIKKCNLVFSKKVIKE